MSPLRVYAAVLATVLAAVLLPPAEAAEADGATAIAVSVRTAGGEPIVARILIVGTSRNQSYQRVTEPDGTTHVPLIAGRYWVTAEARGFQTARESVTLNDGDVRELAFTLVELREIGRTHSRTDVSVATSSPGTPARRISRDLAEALSSVAGLSAIGNPSGLGIHVSLQGADESLSQFSFGGAPLPANAAALAINTDLVQTVQVDQSRDLIAFSGLNPTATAVSKLRLRAGSYGSTFESGSFQDTFGQTGIAVLHTLRAEQSPVNGAYYQDTSGESYRHVSALHTTGDYVKLTGPLGTFAGSVETSASRNLASPLTTYYAGTLPVGTGPGEIRRIAARNTVVALNGTAGANSIAFTYADFSTEDRDAQPNRVVDGVAFPFDLRARGHVDTFSARVERGFARNLTADASVQVFNQRSEFGFAGTTSVAGQHNVVGEVSVHGPQREGDNWSVTYDGGRLGGRPYGALELRAARRFAHDIALSGVVSVGTLSQEGNDSRRARGWIEPYQADFDCSDRTIVTQGPGDTAETPRRLRFFGSLASHLGSVRTSASAWYTKTSGQILSSALVPLDASAGSQPPGYIGDLLHEAASPLRCGSGGAFALFARQDIGGQNTTNRGASATFVTDRGPLHAELSLEYVSTQLDTLDIRLRDAKSVYVAGRQLAGVPPFRATLLLDRSIGAKTEALASVHYEAASNAYNLPPFIATSFGLTRRLGNTSAVTVVAGNVFNSFAGTFVSPRYALAVPTQGGLLLRGVAAPLSPFRISAQYDLTIGH
jgi:hypothetical protein